MGVGVFVNTPCRKLFKTEGFENAVLSLSKDEVVRFLPAEQNENIPQRGIFILLGTDSNLPEGLTYCQKAVQYVQSFDNTNFFS